jgi:hypothetical protein
VDAFDRIGYYDPKTWAIFTPAALVEDVTIGGSVFYLGGSGLVLQNNGADDKTVDPVAGAPVPFTFDTPLAPGSNYDVTVATQPSDPDQECFVVRGSGIVPPEGVTDVLVYCVPPEWLPEGRVFVTSQDFNGDLGGVTGADAKCQAAADAAQLGGGPWTAWISDDTEDAIDRIPNAIYRLLDETLVATDKDDLVTLNLIGFLRNPINIDEFGLERSDQLPWTGTFTDGAASGNDCNNWTDNTAEASGTVGDNNQTDFDWTNSYTRGCNQRFSLYCFGGLIESGEPVTIGGTVSGLTGSGLVLQNNGADDEPIAADGPFTFATPLAPGTTYSVTVKTQPSGQFCTVDEGSGTVPAEGVENVLVTCGDPPGLDEIIATWDNGLWYWDLDTATWTQLSTDTTNEDIAAADFTADGIADVAAVFRFGPASNQLGAGIYYLDGDSKTWTLVPNSAPPAFHITAGDVTGDGRPEVIGAWSVGIWYYDFVAATWTQLTADTTKGDIAAGDFTADGVADVAAIFDFGPASNPQGAGLYYIDGDSKAWTLVPNSAPAPFSVTAGDLTGDDRPEIIATWSVGIFGWDVAATDWVELSRDTTQNGIAAGNFVRNVIADVAAIFEISPVSTPDGPGLYYLNGVTGAAAKIPESAPPPFNVTAGDVTGD